MKCFLGCFPVVKRVSLTSAGLSWLAATVAVSLLFGSTALAEPIAAEYFDYGPTILNLGGLGTAGDGWGGSWSYPSTDNTRPDYSPSANLDLDAKYTSSQYNNSANAGGMAGYFSHASNWYSTYRDFATAQTGTIWVSAILRYADVTTTTSENVFLFLKQEATGSGSADGVGIVNGFASMTYQNAAGPNNGTGTQPLGSGVYLLLVKVDMDYSGTLDRVAMWIDPNLSTGEAGLGTPAILRDNKNALGLSLLGVGVSVSAHTGEGLDAVRVGTTLADVTVGPAPAPALHLVPGTLSFTGHVSDSAPAAQSVLVQNTSVGTLAWTAGLRAPAPAWITLTNASGTNDDSFEVSVNWAGMDPGTYTAYIDVTDPGASNSPQTVTVTMVVEPDPTPLLQLSPGTLNFTGHISDPAPAPQNVTVQNAGIGSLAWTAAVRAPAPSWIALTNASGSDNDAFGVSVNWAGMSAGTYTAYVDVADPQAFNSPQTLTVTIEVQPDPTPLLQLSSASLAFTGKASAPAPAPQSVTVQNTGVGTLNWAAAVRAPAPGWISLTNASGSDGDSFAVAVDWQGMTPGSYTAYIDVADPNAGNSPQTVTLTMQVRSEADTSTHSFSNKTRGSHPGTVTFAGGQVTVDMSALPAGTQVYRAMFVPHRIGCSGTSAAEGYSYQPLQVEASDAPGVWLQTVGPQHLNLDCTVAVQRAMLAPNRQLVLKAVSFAGLGSSNAELRLDVWCDQPAVHTIQQVTDTQGVCRNGDTMVTFSEVNTPITNPNSSVENCKQLVVSGPSIVYDLGL